MQRRLAIVFKQSGVPAVRFVSTLAHGFLDYLVGLIVIGLPFVLDTTGGVRWSLMALGIFVILYSLLTDYELGAVRFLRIRFHLVLDVLFAVSMLALPWVLPLPSQASWPFYVIGLAGLLLAATTKVRAEGTAATR